MATPANISGLIYPEIWVDGVVPHGMHYTGEFAQLIIKINGCIDRLEELDVFELEVDSAFLLQTSQIYDLQVWILDYWTPLWTAFITDPTYGYNAIIAGLEAEDVVLASGISDLETLVSGVGGVIDDVTALGLSYGTDVIATNSDARALTASECYLARLVELSPVVGHTQELELPVVDEGDLTAALRHPILIVRAGENTATVKIWTTAKWGNLAQGTSFANYILLAMGESLTICPLIRGNATIAWGIVGGKTYADLESDP